MWEGAAPRGASVTVGIAWEPQVTRHGEGRGREFLSCARAERGTRAAEPGRGVDGWVGAAGFPLRDVREPQPGWGKHLPDEAGLGGTAFTLVLH